MTLLDVDDLRVEFDTPDGVVCAVDGVELNLAAGETLGIVGESGSGKSMTSFAIAGLLPAAATVVDGTITYRGVALNALSSRDRRALGGKEIAMVYQDALSALNPVLTIGAQLTLALREHLQLDRVAARTRAIELLEAVELPDAEARINDYPHQFSGGQRQRIVIALALSCDPALLIADEPTTALDVTIQSQIIDLVARLGRERDMAVIWVTHDLGVVARLADRIAVMHRGRIVEHAATAELFADPRHPYTRGLLAALPTLRDQRSRLSAAVEVPWREGHGRPCADGCRLTVPARREAGRQLACFEEGGA